MFDVFTSIAARLQNAYAGLRDREEGQTMVEYGLLIAGIALVVIVGIVVLGPAIRDLFQETASSTTNPLPGS